MPAGVLHQLAIRKGAGFNLLPVEAFLALPLGDRVELVVNDRVKFLDDVGGTIVPAEGLRQLRDRSRPPASAPKPASR